jgi:Fur family transcriptional regulator, ferric uptake regulator
MSCTFDDKAQRMLRQAKLYCTESRVAILRVLLEAARPLRQDQIAPQLRNRTLNKVTVYRTLDSLVDAGLVHRAFTHDRAWHFELAHHCTEKQCHPHFTCTSCGVTHCLMDISVPMARIADKGFVVSRQQVRLEGLCPACS